MNESSKFKLSLWRPFSPGTLVIATPRRSDPSSLSTHIRDVSSGTSELQQEVLGWRMLEDAFGGIVDGTEREKLKVALFDALDMEIAPNNRSVGALKSFVNDANIILENGGVEWTGSQSSPADEEAEMRVNPLLALVNHLSWLIEVFDEQPNISVSVR